MAETIVDTLRSNIFDVTRQYMISRRVYGNAEVDEIGSKLGIKTSLGNPDKNIDFSNDDQIGILTVLLNEGRLNLNYDKALEYMLASLKLDVYDDKSFESYCRNAGIAVESNKFVANGQSIAEKLQEPRKPWYSRAWHFLGQGTRLKKSISKGERSSGTQNFFNIILSAYYSQKVLGMASHSFDVFSKYQKLFLNEEDSIATEIKSHGLSALGFTPEDKAFSQITKLITFSDSKEEMLKDLAKSKLTLAGLCNSDAQEVATTGYQVRSTLISKMVEGALLGKEIEPIEDKLSGLPGFVSKPLFELIALEGETKKGLDKNIKTYVSELQGVVGTGITEEFAKTLVAKCAEVGAFGFANKADRFLAYSQAAAKISALLPPKQNKDFGEIKDFKGEDIDFNANVLSLAFGEKYFGIKEQETIDLQTHVKNILEPQKPQEVIDPNVRPAYESLPYYQWCLKQARAALSESVASNSATDPVVEEVAESVEPVEEVSADVVKDPVEKIVPGAVDEGKGAKKTSSTETSTVKFKKTKSGESVTFDPKKLTMTTNSDGSKTFSAASEDKASDFFVGDGGQIELNLGDK